MLLVCSALGSANSRPFRLPGISFADCDVLSGVHAPERVCLAVGPANADTVYALHRANPEMNTHIIVRKITASTTNLANVRPASGFDLDAGADRIAIARGANKAKANPSFAVAAVIAVKARPGIDIDRQNIDIPIV